MAITSKFLRDIRESAEADVPTHSSDASATTPESLKAKKVTEEETEDKTEVTEEDEVEMKAESEDADADDMVSEEDETELKTESEEKEVTEEDETDLKEEDEAELKMKAESEDADADDMVSEEDETELKTESEDEELKEEEDVKLDEEEEEKLAEEEEEAVKEATDALTKDEELPESFKTKVASIFEAAVKRTSKKRAAAQSKKLVESYNKKLASNKKKVSETLVNKVDGYLDYVVEEWMKDNKVAIEGALRSEITEKFIVGLKNLFESHYIEVPAEKANILSEQEQKIKKLESELNNELVKSVELRKENIRLKKSSIIKKLTEGMTVSDAAKFQELCEGVSFENTQSFGQKLKVIKETYFPKTSSGSRDIDASLLTEGGLTHTEEPKITTEVDVFASAISRMVKR